MLAKNFEFIVSEIRLGEVRPLLEDDNAETIGGKLLGENAAGRAGSHNEEIHFVGRFVGHLGLAHFLSVSAGRGCQPG